jgi:hypothetical protein
VAADAVTIATLRDANAKLADFIEKQNAAVKALKDESDRRLSESAHALEAARAAVALSSGRAADILNQKTTGDECQQSKQVLDRYFERLQP